MKSSQDGLNTGMKAAKEKVRELEETLVESIQFEEEGEKEERKIQFEKESFGGLRRGQGKSEHQCAGRGTKGEQKCLHFNHFLKELGFKNT